MKHDEFAARLEPLRHKLYKTALLYLGSESPALDAVDEAVYKGLKSCWKLRQPEYFDTWLTRILINVCYDELRRQKRFVPLEDLPEESAEDYDGLPLREALNKLPEQLREVVILRYFTGYTLEETASALGIPRGTAATRQRKALQLLRLELSEEVTE
ncbi:MAG: sigma-70 family RNA polymerase sigma factor [Clostridia bacterium]|nr:sigma-70 family RNA polymerase sigma factor [Clostridia bacterium]